MAALNVVSLNARSDTPRAAPPGAGAEAAPPARPGEAAGGIAKAGVFVTIESLTFPAATAVTAILLQLVATQVAHADTNLWYALIVSAIVGAIIIFLGMPDANKSKFIAVGLLNILLLTASVLGIGGLTSPETVTGDLPNAISGSL